MSWLPKNSVVLPIDFSEESFAALEIALGFVEDASHLHVVHVLPDLQAGEPGVIWEVMSRENRAKHVEEALHEELTDPKYEGLDVRVEFGSPARHIVDVAAEVKADMIVISSHGRTGWRHLLLGSVTEAVVRHAHCPVLVIRK